MHHSHPSYAAPPKNIHRINSGSITQDATDCAFWDIDFPMLIIKAVHGNKLNYRHWHSKNSWQTRKCTGWNFVPSQKYSKKIYMVDFLYTTNTYQKTAQCRLKRSLVPQGLSGKKLVSENALPHTIFTPKGPSIPESPASSHSFLLAGSCSFSHTLNPSQQASWRLRTNTFACYSTECQDRKADQIQLVAASAAEMTHKMTLNQLELLRNHRLHA